MEGEKRASDWSERWVYELVFEAVLIVFPSSVALNGIVLGEEQAPYAPSALEWRAPLADEALLFVRSVECWSAWTTEERGRWYESNERTGRVKTYSLRIWKFGNRRSGRCACTRCFRKRLNFLFVLAEHRFSFVISCQKFCTQQTDEVIRSNRNTMIYFDCLSLIYHNRPKQFSSVSRTTCALVRVCPQSIPSHGRV